MPKPTNYILRLRAENTALERHIAALAEGITRAQAHLDLPKFSGVDSNGERRDWIATQDVRNMLADLSDLLTLRVVDES